MLTFMLGRDDPAFEKFVEQRRAEPVRGMLPG
jgi:hypothetical protein